MNRYTRISDYSNPSAAQGGPLTHELKFARQPLRVFGVLVLTADSNANIWLAGWDVRLPAAGFVGQERSKRPLSVATRSSGQCKVRAWCKAGS